MNLEYFQHCLRTGRQFVYARMGDGELACMRGDEGENCDGAPYSPELAADLRAAYDFLGHEAFIERHEPTLNQGGEWFPHALHEAQAVEAYREWERRWGYAPWVDFSLAHRYDRPVESAVAFWKAVQASPRKKALVGGPRVLGLAPDLGCDAMYVVPPEDAYSVVDAAAKLAADVAQERGIVVVACGMAAKVIMHRVLGMQPYATVIDAGSAFDPLYGTPSRTGQLSGVSFRDLYGER